MAELNDNPRVLGGQIAEYIRESRAARDSKEPLLVPEAMTNPKAKPEDRIAAEEAYATALLSRKVLSDTETKWLAGQISRCLKGE